MLGINASRPLDTRAFTSLKYPRRLSLYLQPPTGEVSVEDVESAAIDRVQVLKAIEMAQVRQLKDTVLAQQLEQVLVKHRLRLNANSMAGTLDLDAERARDQLGHFILRLAFCRTEEWRRWFITQELALFKYRFQSVSAEERNDFLLNASDFQYVTVTGEEKKEIWPLVEAAAMSCRLAPGTPPLRFEEPLLQVPFEDVADLVQRRAVHLQAGWAYVPLRDALSMLLSRMRAHLEADMELACKALPQLDDADRLLPMLAALTRADVMMANANDEATGAARAGQIRAADVDKVASHFPPCMAHLHRRLREDRHLRYGGRQQFGLFLKSIGLSLEEALLFWRQAFMPRISEDAFVKQYSYNIRHNYGQEGKRVNYQAFNCVKIITSNPPAAGDSHGCPFRHFGPEALQTIMSRYRTPANTPLPANVVADICSTAQRGHYQVACTQLFEATRGLAGAESGKTLDMIVQPSDYYLKSISLASGSAA